MLTTWVHRVDELRNQYKWLLFFSIPKMLLLHNLLRAKDPNLKAIVHEISFLCCNDQAVWESVQVAVKVSTMWRRGEMETEEVTGS